MGVPRPVAWSARRSEYETVYEVADRKADLRRRPKKNDRGQSLGREDHSEAQDSRQSLRLKVESHSDTDHPKTSAISPT